MQFSVLYCEIPPKPLVTLRTTPNLAFTTPKHRTSPGCWSGVDQLQRGGRGTEVFPREKNLAHQPKWN